MAFSWLLLATKLPLVIQGLMQIVEKVKGAKGEDKKAAVLAAIPESVALAELFIGKDLLNDTSIAKLISAYIDAAAAKQKAEEALRAGILAKQ